MNHSHADQRQDRARRTRRGFTLAELVVAVGLVVILTLGIGQLFGTVTRLTGTGSAIAELDALARVVESQMREDAEAFRALRATGDGGTFLAIRQRRLGDANFDGDADDPGERLLFISRRDRDTDARAGRPPFSENSLAATVRLDEVAFLIGGSGRYFSYQQSELGLTDVQELFALVQYGHGLRPRLDPEFDPTETDLNDRSSIQLRQYVADGADPQEFMGTAFGAPGTRNEFAGEFVLGRQQIVLFGGLASGFADDFGTPVPDPESPITNQREYVPYINESMNLARFANADYFGGPPDGVRINFGDASFYGDPPVPGTSPAVLPNPRLRVHGRADIAAQSYDDVVRWLEGEAPKLNAAMVKPIEAVGGTDPRAIITEGEPDGLGLRLPDASAYDAGLFDAPFNAPTSTPGAFGDFRLWERVSSPTAEFRYSPVTGGPLLPNDQVPGGPVNAPQAVVDNAARQQTAIAGVLSRTLIEPEPTVFRQSGIVGVGDPQDARMDLSALLAERCSSFEIAWSDGSRWALDEPGEWDANGDGDLTDDVDRNLFRGDLIWFDMDFTKADLYWLLEDQRGIDFARAQRLYPRNTRPDPEIGFERDYGPRDGDISTFTTIPDTTGVAVPYGAGDPPDREERLVTSDLNNIPGTVNGGFAPVYLTGETGGVPIDTGTNFGDEYLAIWGLNELDGFDTDYTTAGFNSGINAPIDGGFTEIDGVRKGVPKPRYLRIRMTLHDREFRIPGGRTYEFILDLGG